MWHSGASAFDLVMKAALTTGTDCSLTVIPLGSLALPRISTRAFVGPGFEIEVADPFTIAIRQCAVAIMM
jgi:hypothetical protein